MSNNTNIYRQIFELIQSYNTIILHRHIHPDPDALGAQGGLQRLIEANFPDKVVYTVGQIPENLEFLGVKTSDIRFGHYQQALVIVLDTANQARIDDQRYNLGEKIIKIDHHPATDPYGDVQWVEDHRSSTSEMIVQLSHELGNDFKMTKEAAELLYAGIVGDTGRFLYDSVDANTFYYAGQLQEAGVNTALIGRNLDQMPLKVAQLAGYVYSHVNINENGLAYVDLTNQLLRKFNVDSDESSMIVPLIGKIEEVKIWVIFVAQADGTFRCRIRSKEVTINHVAEQYRGGGHHLASGAKVHDLSEREALLESLNHLLENE